MLKLLIVEDEEATREGLRSLINWESLGITISGLAANGMEALRMFEALPADLLLTDIRMPLMDGLQLIAELRKRGHDIPCVLLSGYNEFEYAQRAMRSGVSDYVIKPCSPDEILAVFATLTARIAEERRHTDELKGLAQQLHVHLPHAKTQLFRQWLNYPAMVTEKRLEQMKSVEMAIGYEHVIVMTFQIDSRMLENLNYDETGTQLLNFAAANIIKESLEHALLQPIEIVQEGDLIVAIGNGLIEWIGDKLHTGLVLVAANLKQFLNLTASAGISRSQTDINKLHIAYREALEALELRFFRGAGHYFYSEAAGQKKESLPDCINPVELLKLEQSALEHMRGSLYAEVLNDTERWLAAFQADYHQSRKQINGRALLFLNRLLHVAQERDSSETDLLGYFDQISEQLQLNETLEELSGFVYGSIRRIVEVLNPQKAPKRKVQQALDYIEEHYRSSGLSLAGVAKALFVSSTYLSTLFKQELGVNFLDYVHQYRIEKAKARLQAGDQKIQTVAREVGYFDEAHFTRTFKKWTGTLPSQYKKERLQRS
ncbi:response regulator [Paenibacillus solisilvae]|uniref:Response regulator n=1 Tax=Paenibacillus solisilvae TaxID=2486751 RepID=A0ABW0VP97_9BACL